MTHHRLVINMKGYTVCERVPVTHHRLVINMKGYTVYERVPVTHQHLATDVDDTDTVSELCQ